MGKNFILKNSKKSPTNLKYISEININKERNDLIEFVNIFFSEEIEKETQNKNEKQNKNEIKLLKIKLNLKKEIKDFMEINDINDYNQNQNQNKNKKKEIKNFINLMAIGKKYKY